MIRTKKNRKIATKDHTGKSNGYLIPIYNVHENFVEPAQHPVQVYLTVVAPKSVKGPHLHKKRWGLFTCVRGNIEIVMRTEQGYQSHWSGEAHEYASIQLPAGTPAALVNHGEGEAFVLNMPAPAWRAEDPDDHDVTFDGYDFFAARK